jgi:CheY-like chemotaxis protein
MALKGDGQRPGLLSNSGPGRSLNILVVEDNALVRRMTSEFLHNLGCDVMSAPDGASARDALGYADGVIIDVGLPDCSGADLVEEMRWSDAELPVIVATARVDQELRDRFAADLRTQLLPKPFTEAQLRRAVEQLRAMTAERR